MLKEANRIIRLLNLQKHPEGGYYSEVFRSDEIIGKKSLPARYKSKRCLHTSIYFLLKGNDFSAFHRLNTDEIWHFYSGSKILIHIIENKNRINTFILGNNLKAGEKFQIIVKKGHWFAAEVEDKKSYALIGCTMSPGFDFEDFELGEHSKLIRLYPKHREIIEKFTKII